MEAVKRGSKRDFGTVKVESGNCVVCNQGERWGVELYRKMHWDIIPLIQVVVVVDQNNSNNLYITNH